MFKRIAAVVGAMALAATFATTASAAELDFGVIAPSPGTISYAGGAAPLVGSGIEVDNVTGINGTPLNNDVSRNMLGGVLSFTTGNLTGSTATTWNFGGGGSINITGCADLNNSGTCVAPPDASGSLLTGTISSASVVASGGTFKVAIAAFVSTIDATLAAFYGLPAGQYSGNFNISFNATGNPPSGFTSSSILSGDIVTTPVPEPASLLLLGSGLLGAASAARRRFARR